MATDPTGLTEKTPEGVPRGAGGHHPVPWASWKNRGFPVSVQHIFNEVIPHNPDHVYDAAHRVYNQRAGELLGQWADQFDDVSKITDKQARAFQQSILNSTDPFIKGYLDQIQGLKSKQKIAEWFNSTGKEILEAEAKTVSTLGKGARAIGSIANKAGKVFKIIAIGTAIYYVSEGGVVYAAEKTVKDAVFYDEIAPHVKKVATIVEGELHAEALRVNEHRYRFLDKDLRDHYLRGALRKYPDVYRLKFGCDPEDQ